VILERFLVDVHVDQRIEPASVPGPSRRGEHREQGIEASLPGSAFQQLGVHPVAPLGDTGIPIGAELGVAEPGEDLLDHRPSRHTASSVEIDPLLNDADMGVTTVVGSFMGAVSTIGISQRFPTAHHHRELVEPQRRRMTDQQLRRTGNCSAHRGLECNRVSRRVCDTPS
jgi:hypothetical protein